ncbi:MAG TPA: Gfo/Idh/MocA family oxidoreductase [Pseudonocardiaceae bacterium]|nr:Gfo/Idh/MocA family oxidoreductase [Pseudonocardiaceae bacterium]
MARCRIGFIGAGGVAARHARTLAPLPLTELVAVTDTDPVRADRFATEHGLRAVPDVDALLDTGLNAAYVCVPPYAHGALEEAVVGAGVALFVEKPLGLDLAVPERVMRAVTDAGVVTAVGHHWRYSSAVDQAQALLADRPRHLVLASWLDRVPPVPWWVQRDRSGGQIVEQVVHVLDLARVLVGEVTQVSAMTDRAPPDHPDADIDGATAAVLRFAGGAVGTLAATCRLGWKHRACLEVYADGLALAVSEEGLEVYEGGSHRTTAVAPEAAKRAADLAFTQAVLGATDTVRAPYADALRTHRLACAVAESAAGQPIDLPERADAS